MTDLPFTPGYGPGPAWLARYRAEIEQLHDLCTRLVEALAPRLPEPDRRRVRTGLAVGEWLPLLDDLLAALHQDRIPITPGEHDLLVSALDLLGAGDHNTPNVRERDTLLPSLVLDAAAAG